MLPTSQYVEVHNGGYYVAGTRVGLDVLTSEFRRGASAEAIFQAYPSMGSLAKVYGAITFVLEHPLEVDAYLREQQQIFEELTRQSPMPTEMLRRLEAVDHEGSTKPT